MLWTGRKRDVVHHWPCAGSRIGVERRAFLMPNNRRLATQQTPTLHLIIIDILHVTKYCTYQASDKYLPIDGKKSSGVGPYAPGQGCARVRPERHPFSATPSPLHTSRRSTSPSDFVSIYPSWHRDHIFFNNCLQQLPVSSLKTIVSP